jgi:hypothetical protein
MAFERELDKKRSQTKELRRALESWLWTQALREIKILNNLASLSSYVFFRQS